MIQSHSSILLIRIAFFLVILLLITALLGPFQGVEREFGLEDTQAHIIAFYVLGVMALIALPTVRKSDIFIFAIGLAALTELVQAVVGRSASFVDWGANMIGLLLAFLPTYATEFRSSVSSTERFRKTKVTHYKTYSSFKR